MNTLGSQGLEIAGRYQLLQPYSDQLDIIGTQQWLAIDLALNTTVRILLIDDIPTRPDALDAARRASLIEDAHVVRTLSVGSNYVVTEVPLGKSLQGYVNGYEFSPSVAKAIVGELAAILSQSASHGLRHLRLVPSRVRVGDAGDVYVDGLAIDAALANIHPNTTYLTSADNMEAEGLTIFLATLITGKPASPETVSSLVSDTSLPDDIREVFRRSSSETKILSPGEVLRVLAPFDKVNLHQLPPYREYSPVFAVDQNSEKEGSHPHSSSPQKTDSQESAPGLSSSEISENDGSQEHEPHGNSPTSSPDNASDVLPTDAVGESTPDVTSEQLLPADSQTPEDTTVIGKVPIDVSSLKSSDFQENVDPLLGAPTPADVHLQPQWDFPGAVEEPQTQPSPQGDTKENPPADTADSTKPPAPDVTSDIDKLDVAHGDDVLRDVHLTQEVSFPSVHFENSSNSTPPHSDDEKVPPSNVEKEGEPSISADVDTGTPQTKGIASIPVHPLSSGATRLQETDIPSHLQPSFPKTGQPPEPENSAHDVKKKSPLTVDPKKLHENILSRAIIRDTQTDKPISKRIFNSSKLIVTATVLLVIFALFFAAKNFFTIPTVNQKPRPSITSSQNKKQDEEKEKQESAAQSSPTPSPTPTTPAPPPEVASYQLINPNAGEPNEDNPGLLTRAFDKNPQSRWTSWRYTANAQFSGLKPGFGFEIKLKQPTDVHSITLNTRSSGGMVEWRRTTSSNPSSGDLITQTAFAPQTTITPPKPEKTDTIILWVTELPKDSRGSWSLQLFEVTVQ
ncbi:hypothetical protein CJ184_002920 [Actinotignum urinale]|uniref:hypothetical protein n=1 Tax=Actinotignum urinale TaxID=190146 RepID=UPI000C80EEF1|nr:hypothetical protein [Actinotignum urinale]WIK59608.1 hypothetical protein CJ184_002920 [Actinotignum urinale]